MTAYLAQSCNVWAGVVVIVALVVVPQAVLAVWALRNPNEEGSEHA